METLTPEALMERIKKDNEDKVDFYAMTHELQYLGTTGIKTHGLLTWESPEFFDDVDRRYLHLTSESQKRFFQDLGGPDRYFTKVCDIPMQEANVDFLWSDYKDEHERVLVRCRRWPGDEKNYKVRAVMDEDFPIFDNYQFAEALIKPMQDYKMDISSIIIDEDMMQVNAHFSNNEFNVGSLRFRPGLQLINSEVGRYKPAVHATLRPVGESGVIYWPVDGGAIVQVSRKDLTNADLAIQLEKSPSVAHEEIDNMKESLEKASASVFEGDYTLKLHLMMRGANVPDNGSKLQEMVTHITYYKTRDNREQTTKLDMIRAVASVANNYESVKLSKLAGDMLTKDAVWKGSLLNQNKIEQMEKIDGNGN